MERRETKSPIKDLPVHQAGASSRKYVDKLIDEKAIEPVLMASLIVLLAIMEWFNYFLKVPIAVPIIFSIAAVVAVVWVFFKVRAVHSKVKALRLGIMGEEAVGQYLEEKLRPMGCQVMHDIPGAAFNLDHVVIGPTGVFCIETKTYSKPAHGSPIIEYDGEKVTVDGFTPDRDAIVQVKSASRWLHDLLERTTGKKFIVKPIVLYPGWFVKKMPANAEVWVLNHKNLPTFISNTKNTLPPEDVALITFHLKRYVISEMENKK